LIAGAVLVLQATASGAIYMDEDFEGATPFINRNWPVQSDSAQPVQPLAMGLNLRAWGAGYTSPSVALQEQSGSVVNTRAYAGTQCYRLASGQRLAVTPGQFPFRNGNWFRAWQFAVGTDTATAGLPAGTQVGRFKVDYSNDSTTDLTPDVSIVLALRVNASGGVDLVSVNKANAILGTLTGGAGNWLLVTLVAMNKVTTGAMEDTTEGWAAYDPFAGIYKGPQPANPASPSPPPISTGVHIYVDGAAATHTVLTRVGELGVSWGNETSGKDTTSEIGWEFAADNGGTIYLDNLSWDAGAHQQFGRGMDREQAARLTQFGAAHAPSLPGIVSSIKRVYMVTHAHLDIGFTKPPEVVAGQYKTIIDAQVNFAKTRPDYRWTVEETWQLEQWMKRSTPAQISEFASLENAGQIRVAAGHSTLHSAKAGAGDMSRLLWNAARYRNAYGFNIETLYHDDVPGVNWAYPQVLAKSGVKYLVAGENLFIGGGITQPYKSYLFRWEGPDGSRVLTWSARESYAQGVEMFWWVGSVDEAKLAAALKDLTDAGYPYDAVMIQTAFDNLSGTSPYTNAVNWNNTHSNPLIIPATAEEFFEYMEGKYGPQIPVLAGNWISPWDTSGIEGPREIKIAKNAQTLLPAAEQMNGLADSLGAGSFDAARFDTCWDHVLQIDEHTGPGASWPEYWTQAEVDAANVQYWQYATEASDILTSALATGVDNLLGAFAVPASDSVVVYNPLSWVRTDIARVPLTAALLSADFTLRNAATGETVTCQKDAATSTLLFLAADVPPVGFRRYRIDYSPAPGASSGLSAGPRVLENARLRVTLGDNGCVTGIFDKAAGRELVDAADPFEFNRMIQGTNLQWFFGVNDAVPDPPTSPTVTLSVAGPVAAVLNVTRLGHPHAGAKLILYAGLDRIDIVNTPDRSQMLFASLADNSRYYGIAFPFDLAPGAVARVDTAAGWYDPGVDTVPGAYRSAFGIQNCVDLSEAGYGVTVATPDVYIHAFGGFQNGTFPPPNPTLVSTFIRYGDEADILGSATGTVTVEPGASPQWDLLYSIRPHARGFDPVADARFGWEACTPMQCKVVPAAGGGVLTSNSEGFLRVSAPNVIITGIKKADFGDGLIVTMQEIAGAPSTPLTLSSDVLWFSAVQPVTPLEADAGPPLTVIPTQQVSFAVGQRGIVCLRLTVSGVASVANWMLY
jgi:hypothetical protein